MKIRYGFVSNSSSSSFVCSICKDTATDYDGECEIEHEMCENGHDMCSKHLKIKRPSLKEMREALIKDVQVNYPKEDWAKETDLIEGFEADEVEDSYADMMYDNGIPASQCPLCSFKILTDDDLLDYLLMLTGSTKKSMIEQALKTYPNLDAFEMALKAHKKAMREQGKK